jgi:acyl-CoA synthetase (AMP-forming)/AMP-acid ligase II
MDRRVWHAHYDDGVPIEFGFVDRTLPEALDRSASSRGDHTALWFQNRRMTYGELKVHVDRLATALAALPFFHIFGMTICMNFPVWSACAMVLVPNPRDFTALLQSVAKRRVTLFMGVPAMFNAINNHPDVKAFDLSCVKSCFSGSAPLPVDVLQRFESLTGARIVEGFGLTETSSPATTCTRTKWTASWWRIPPCSRPVRSACPIPAAASG